MDYTLKFDAIFEDELYNTPPLMRVIVARANCTKHDIPRIFRLTKDFASVADFRHLRRIRDTEDGCIECIICKLGDEDDEEIVIKRLEHMFSQESLFSDYHSKLVPSRPPRTEHQWKASRKIWPCKYAKSNHLIQCIDGTVFTGPERVELEIIVNNLIEKFSDTSTRNQSAAVIFRSNKIHGLGLTNKKAIDKDATKHSAMIAIDYVAKGSGGGHWAGHEDSEVRQLVETIQNDLDVKQSQPEDVDGEITTLPYLCTNYDVLVTEEPCIMCTMGLIQSRIRRLFYLDLSSMDANLALEQTCYNDRAIGKFIIHRDRNLNHRMEAWIIKLISKKSS